MKDEKKLALRHYSRTELEGLASTLRDLLRQKFRESTRSFARHKKEILEAHPFLKEVFTALDDEANWEDMLARPPGKVEVTVLEPPARKAAYFLTSPNDLLVRPLNKEERMFLSLPGKMLTLYVSLPKGCIQESHPDKKLRWGAEMPNEIYFGEDRKMTESARTPQYVLCGMMYPYR